MKVMQVLSNALALLLLRTLLLLFAEPPVTGCAAP
jgi:hypothetical protein